MDKIFKPNNFLIELIKTYNDNFFNKKIVGFEVIYKFATIIKGKG
jgi:hypothetical protein